MFEGVVGRSVGDEELYGKRRVVLGGMRGVVGSLR